MSFTRNILFSFPNWNFVWILLICIFIHSMLATWFTYLIVLHLVTKIIFSEE
jgi:hypothetical protein